MNQPHEHFETLLVKATDNCLSDDERRQLQQHLSGCKECQADLAAFVGVKEATNDMRQRILDDVLHDPIRPSSTTHTINRLGFWAMVIASAVAVGWGAFELWRDDNIPMTLRVGLLACGAIALVVFGNVLRLRLRSRPTDPYREIDQ